MKRITIFLFLLNIIFNIVSSQSDSDILKGPIKCFSYSLEQLFSPNSQILYAIALVIFLVIISYMVGQTIHNPYLLMWAKTEGLTLFWSVILILIIVGAINFSCLAASFFLPKELYGINPILYISSYFDKIISFSTSKSIQLVKESFQNYFDSMQLYADAESVAPTSGTFGVYYLAGKREWSTYKETLNSYLIPLLASIYAQKFIVENLFAMLTSFILPAGIFLRIIPLLRDAGDFIIAISISLYIFVPLIYVCSFVSIEKIFQTSGPEALNKIIDLGDNTIGDSLAVVGFLTILAVFIPNLILVIVITCSMGIFKALKGFFSG
ncbi:MAG: hypothetical protein N3D10_02230 [Candidatus Micrarchaeota archaeon]|nr:hypothetical protein [Candidatus Micrarchaeota archaeon]